MKTLEMNYNEFDKKESNLAKNYKFVCFCKNKENEIAILSNNLNDFDSLENKKSIYESIEIKKDELLFKKGSFAFNLELKRFN